MLVECTEWRGRGSAQTRQSGRDNPSSSLKLDDSPLRSIIFGLWSWSLVFLYATTFSSPLLLFSSSSLLLSLPSSFCTLARFVLIYLLLLRFYIDLSIHLTGLPTLPRGVLDLSVGFETADTLFQILGFPRFLSRGSVVPLANHLGSCQERSLSGHDLGPILVAPVVNPPDRELFSPNSDRFLSPRRFIGQLVFWQLMSALAWDLILHNLCNRSFLLI